jgi:hypothetical protein
MVAPHCDLDFNRADIAQFRDRNRTDGSGSSDRFASRAR